MVAAQIFLAMASTTFGNDVQLLCFGASWCEPCRAMQPILAQLSASGYPLRKLDVDQHGEWASRFQVSVVPAFVLVDGSGRVLHRIDRAATMDELVGLFGRPRAQASPTTVRGQAPESRPPRQLQPMGQTPPPLQTSARSSNLGSTSAPTQTAPSRSGRDAALASTVRLKVEDQTGHSFGTGTVIDVQGDEALILTCGHIFRESQGKGRILIDRFDTSAQPSDGTVVSYDLDLDIGLVTMKLSEPIAAAKLATAGSSRNAGDIVFSIGCNHGEPPTIVDGRINQINKYLGPANITASGRPVDGRSGGGLFTEDGRLLGVCTAADPELDEGIYAGLQRAYAELDRHGLSFVYEKNISDADVRTAAVAAAAPSTPQPAAIATAAGPASLDAVPNPQLEPPPARNITASYEVTQPADAGSSNELVCVLRSDGEAQGRVFVIRNPSRVLLEYLGREADRR